MEIEDIAIKILIVFFVIVCVVSFGLFFFFIGSTMYVSIDEVLNPVEEIESISNLTLTQENALARAKSYVSVMGISKKELVKQLEFEGYSAEDAAFAATNCGANYEYEAAEKAESLLSIAELSRKSLAEQLEIEGFERNEINHALDAVGY